MNPAGTRRLAGAAFFLLLGGCAGTLPPAAPPAAAPRETVPPVAEAPPETTPPEAPAAGERAAPESGPALPDVSGEGGIGRFTERLAAAPDAERPLVLLGRAREAIRTGQDFLRARQRGFGALSFEDEPRFLAFHARARRDCEEILRRHPMSPQAPEAQLTLGVIHDYPNLSLFEEAEAHYRRTVERYPGTEAANAASERLARLRKYLDAYAPAPGSSHTPVSH